MPSITRRFLATAATMLLLGVGLGYLMLIRRDLLGMWPSRGIISAHTHLILVGGVIQLIVGTAWWLFPRPPRSQPQAPETAVRAAWWCLTLGTLARATGELLVEPIPSLLGGTGQLLGMVLVVIALRRRVVPARIDTGR
jgi:hypothetical protein